MKKLIIIALLFAAISTHAQCPVGFNAITSYFAPIQTICVIQNGRECTPKIVSIKPDTIRSAIYSFTVTRDTTQNLNVYITTFDRKGNIISLNPAVSIPAPGSGYKHWGLLTGVLDTYISGQLNTLYGVIFH